VRIAIAVGACALMMTARAAAAPPTTPPAPTTKDTPGPPVTAPSQPADPASPLPDDVTPTASATDTPGTDKPKPTVPPKPIVGFVVRGDSKLKPRTVGYLAHVQIGDKVDPTDLPRLQQALMSSELFKTVDVSLADAPNGVALVVNAVDKHSWIIAPTAFILPGSKSFGLGYAENNLGGTARKMLLYGQISTGTSLLFGTFLDPAVHGTKWTWHTDLYTFRRYLDEYANPANDPTSFDISRTTRTTYLGGGALVGYNFLWWLAADLRLRGAYVYYRDARDPADNKVALPEKDGWDVTLQAHLTVDHRHHLHGVTWGTYAQLDLEPSVPGIDSYGYQLLQLRAYHSWRLFGEHELELRGHLNVGRHLPLHEELTLGGASDLRGYDVDQFRGDFRTVGRAEYSVPLFKYRFLAFRALAFYDLGYLGLFNERPDDRLYLPGQRDNTYRRSDVGGGLRVYLDNIVLPLLGFDIAYGIEGHSPEIYFEVGLTDF
jgi:outer membrane protein assembly factor BamA